MIPLFIFFGVVAVLAIIVSRRTKAGMRSGRGIDDTPPFFMFPTGTDTGPVDTGVTHDYSAQHHHHDHSGHTHHDCSHHGGGFDAGHHSSGDCGGSSGFDGGGGGCCDGGVGGGHH